MVLNSSHHDIYNSDIFEDSITFLNGWQFQFQFGFWVIHVKNKTHKIQQNEISSYTNSKN